MKSERMSVAFHTRRRVEFRDTDAAGIMHFSVFFTCMEAAEHAFLRELGTSVHTPLAADDPAQGALSWPRVAAECHYSGSARFEDMLDIELQVARIGSSSVTYACRFLVDGREIATGSLTSVCCRFVPGHPPASTPIPDTLRVQLAEYLIA
jgi:4-hydroxybenzoyl-CoA thioesterase/acyl-CoA thioester hydrolase